MGLTNPAVAKHMEAIFGAERVARLRQQVDGLAPPARERLVLESLTATLGELGGQFVLPFCFRSAEGRTTHYLILVSKHFKGYELMREIMARHSTKIVEGVPNLEHNLKDMNADTLELPLIRQ